MNRVRDFGVCIKNEVKNILDCTKIIVFYVDALWINKKHDIQEILKQQAALEADHDGER